MDSERIPCSPKQVFSEGRSDLLQGQASEYIKEKFIALRFPVVCCGESSKGVIAMKKMTSLTFFAFTPAYGPYVEDKVITGPGSDDSAVRVACKGRYGLMKTDLVVTR